MRNAAASLFGRFKFKVTAKLVKRVIFQLEATFVGKLFFSRGAGDAIDADSRECGRLPFDGGGGLARVAHNETRDRLGLVVDPAESPL